MTTLEVGQKAPDFTALDENGKTVQLADYIGSKLVLYFYPKDNTPGCNAQACNLRDNYDELLEKGYKILGVSPDPAAKHLKFIAKFELNFNLIADVDKELLNKYEVWGLKKFMGREYDGVHRTTFVISEDGIIEQIIKKVKTKDHAAQILAE